MSVEKPSVKEHFFVKGAVKFVAVLVILGFAFGLAEMVVKKHAMLAKPV